MATGPCIPAVTIDLNRSATGNFEALARAKGVKPAEIIACVLDRPRHEKLIAELRGIGCGCMLIPDGDVAGVIATSNPAPPIDVYMGPGGAPEDLSAAASRRCGGGQLPGLLWCSNDDARTTSDERRDGQACSRPGRSRCLRSMCN